jgi:protease PrsW
MAYSIESIAISISIGVLPTLLWLLFWLRKDRIKNKPKGLFILCYILGAAVVLLVIPAQRLIYNAFGTNTIGIGLLAAVEELAKFLVINTIALKSQYANRPVDFAMFLVCGALGFAALENVFYILEPVSRGNLLAGFLTGNVRFLGSTLLHAMASGLFGVALGLSFYRNWEFKPLYVIGGFTLATLLHSTFNFFIISNNGGNMLEVLSFLWIIAILNILLFEKLKRMNNQTNLNTQYV